MCGIAGILNSKIDLKEEKQKNILEKISESLKSRGPDGHGEYTEHHAAPLHRRTAGSRCALGHTSFVTTARSITLRS